MASELIQLANFIIAHFDLSEINHLCFELSVRYDDLGGDSRISDKARNLVLILGRSGRLHELLSTVKNHRLDSFPFVIDETLLSKLYAQMSALGNHDQLSDAPRQLPLRPVHFTNREATIESIITDLEPGRVLTVCGPSGIGKSALVAETLYRITSENRFWDRFPDGLIYHDFSIDPFTDHALEHITLTYREQPKPTPLTAARRVLANRQALIVLDSAEATDDLRKVFSICGSCGVLITSQRQTDAYDEQFRYDILPLQKDDSLVLLKKIVGKHVDNETIIKRVNAQIGGFPLAARLVGQYLCQLKEFPEEYLNWLEKDPVLALYPWGKGNDGFHKQVFKNIQGLTKIARYILGVIGYLSFAPFRIQLISHSLGIPTVKTAQVLTELMNYGFLVHSKNLYQISHKLLHAYARQHIPIPNEIKGRIYSYYHSLVQGSHEQGVHDQNLLEIERPHIMTLLVKLEAEEKWREIQDITYYMRSYLIDYGHWTDHKTTLQIEQTSFMGSGYQPNTFMLTQEFVTSYAEMGWAVDELKSLFPDSAKGSSGKYQVGRSPFQKEQQTPMAHDDSQKGIEIESISQKASDIPADKLYERPHSLQQPQRGPAIHIAGQYEVAQTISGGMAMVHLCLDHKTGLLVALKTFKPEYLSSRKARDLFLREGTMWVDIGRHPHIVNAYRVERVGDGLEIYLVLEWIVPPKGIEKPSLRSWLVPGRPLPIKQALTFAIHIARGMKYATKKITGLVHRDLKPENILIGYDGNARVTDFGLASTLSGLLGPSTSTIGGLFSKAENFMHTQIAEGAPGTPLYMAPEQWLRLPLDVRTDIYAFGCILYEMIVGRFAIYGKTIRMLKETHLSGRIKPPPLEIPSEITLLLRKCLATQREQRFGGWAEVENALKGVYLRVIGETFPPERLTTAETREERLMVGQSYNSMGLSYLDIGKLSVALMYFEQAVWIAREEKSLALEGSGLGNVGLAQQAFGYVERAIEFHQENLTIARQIGDREQEGHAYGNLGRAYRQLGKTEEAVKYHKHELYIAQEIGNRFKEASALNSLGDAYWVLGSSSQAIEYYKQSLALARQIEDRARVKSILSSVGRVYLNSSDVKGARTFFRYALNLARQIGDRVGEGDALADLGYLHHTLNYQDRAVEFYNHALKIAQESHDKRREVIVLASIAAIRREAKEFNEAKGLYEASLAAAEEINDQLKQMEMLNRLGEVHGTLGDFIHAAGLHKRVLTLADGVGMREIGRQALFDLGRDYEQWGDVGRAIEYYQQHLAAVVEHGGGWELKKNVLAKFGPMYARLKQFRASIEGSEQYLEQSRANRDPLAELDALQQLGLVYRVIADTGKAANYYRDALAVAYGLHDGEAEAATLSNLALTYYDMGRKWQATRNMEKAMARAQETKNSLLIATTAYRLALILCKQKKWSKALPYADRAEELFQALQNETMLQRTNKLINAIEEQQERTTGFLF